MLHGLILWALLVYKKCKINTFMHPIWCLLHKIRFGILNLSDINLVPQRAMHWTWSSKNKAGFLFRQTFHVLKTEKSQKVLWNLNLNKCIENGYFGPEYPKVTRNLLFLLSTFGGNPISN